MASNREERLQMRQRGAGTRKIQAVDFGFSFGSPPAASQSVSIAQDNQVAPAAEVTNSIDAVVAKPLTPPINDEGFTRITTPKTRTPRTSIAAVQSPHRSSARKSVGRASISNAVDEQEEGGRSSKRRRISTENERATPTSASRSTPVPNAPPSATRADSPQTGSPQNGIVADEASPGLAAATAAEVADNDLQTVDVEQEAELEQEVVQPKRRGRTKTTTSPLHEDSNRRTSEAGKQTRNRPVRRQSAVNGPEPREDPEEGPSKPSNRKRRGGLQEQPSGENGLEDDHESEHGNAESRSSKRRQKPKEKPISEPEQKGEEDTGTAQQTSRGKRKSLGRPARNVEPEPEENQQDDTAAQTRRKRKGKQKETEKIAESADVQDDTTAAQSSGQTEARKKQQESGGGSRRRGRPSLEKAQQAEPAPETEPEPTEPTDKQPETSTEQGQAAKRRRGKPSGVANGNETTSRQRTRQRDTQDETAEGEREKRRTGGTVSITVHRLTNTQALDPHADSSSDRERDSADELQLEVAGKRFPSRTGVNAADVLSQICKEILDKHVTALDTNIANDTANQSKRTEYTRQRKAVEAYGTQLEGRLFELSELLDSNFTLGVQLKRAKREAAEMRNRLLAVRQQRHEITLQMDAVRRKHGEEENAKMSRNAINNALHNLELTLDRNRVRHDDNDSGEEDTGIAGLEFLLRSVSDNVSSAAEGSHGGLLNQVKAFNAQLERAAKKLER